MAGLPPTVAPSPQHVALTKHSLDLCSGITRISTVTSFALSLEQKYLITSDAKSSILNVSGVSDEGKCVRLLDAVKEQVRVDPAKFEPFIDILRREPALSWYTETVTATRGEYRWS